MDKSTLKPTHLRRIRSLAQLGDEQLNVFLNFVELVSCAYSETLFHEGDPGESMFLILEGKLRVYVRQKNNEVTVLRIMNAGDAFGEVALLNQAARSASIEAVESSLLLKISAAALQKLISEQPVLAAQLLYHLAKSLGHQLTDLTTKLRAQRDYAHLVSFLQ
jgi:CRP/FNR family transcriptional regulator, cyclic AMP receptor protein